MKNRMSLLAGVGLGALLVMGAALPASAETADQAKIRQLEAQVQMLAARLDAQEAAQKQTQATAADAQATAEAAQTAADNQIKTIPQQVTTAVAALPQPKKSWSDDTTISGRMYYNLSTIEQKQDGNKVAPSGTGLDVKRFYVGIDHRFNDIFSANVTTDFNYVSNDSETQVYIKKAYLQAKLSDALIVRVGSADLPWVPFVEDIYGYRYVENTLIDRTKFGTSADWGVHLSGSFNSGMFSYAVSAVDGAGYKAPLRSNGVDLEGRVSAKFDHIVVGLGGYTGKLGKDVEGTNTYHTAQRVDAVVAYVDKRFRIGGEYFSTTDWNNVTTVASDSADGYSLFGSYNFTDKIGVFGRYDWVKPKKDTVAALDEHYFNVGVTYTPVKNVDFALVYKRDKAEDGIIATSNGNIGGIDRGTYDEVGIFGQFRY